VNREEATAVIQEVESGRASGPCHRPNSISGWWEMCGMRGEQKREDGKIGKHLREEGLLKE